MKILLLTPIIRMKTIFSTAIALIFMTHVFSQETLNKQHIIELGKYYSRFMFNNDPSKELSKNLGKDYQVEMMNAVLFINEVTKSNNKILSEKYLTLPDTTTLKIIYIIDALHQNPHLKNPLEPNRVVNSLITEEIPYDFLVDQYYNMIFVTNGNKNKPFDMSKVNFRLNEYHLNERQKAIFYLRCMDACGSQIFGYMNIVNPPNTAEALKYIQKFPHFDGLDYFQYSDFQFEDFSIEIYNDKGLESFKEHFINQLFELLLNHAVCLSKEKSNEEVQDFLLSSPLKDQSLWKYTELEEVLKSIFKED